MRKLIRVLAAVLALTAMAWSASYAQQAPLLPVSPTDYAQCDAFSQQYSAYLRDLRTKASTCERNLTPSEIRYNRVRVQCVALDWPAACAAEVELSACAHNDQAGLLAQCRAMVRAAQENLQANMPPDYRDQLIGDSFDQAFKPDNMLPKVARDLISKAKLLDSFLKASDDPSAAKVLDFGQNLAKNVYALTGPGALAKALFNSAVSGVAGTGAMAINDAEDALARFDMDYQSTAPQIKGVPVAALIKSVPAPAPTQHAPSSGGGQSHRQTMCSHGVPDGAYYCANDYNAYGCHCSGGVCRLNDYAFGGCNNPGTIMH
ncbi:hypothetical protein [Devosia sp.]|uniref:hypothetical protein n=1 Tax=Devosia sp. TaxID=1871048 RepID=UPI003264928B